MGVCWTVVHLQSFFAIQIFAPALRLDQAGDQ
jgi:hypothetical protein